MRVRVVLTSAVLATGVVAGLGVAPASAAATTGSISVDVAAGQQVSLDPYTLPVTVTWSANGCPRGCDLYRVGHLRANVDEQLVDSRTFAAGSRQTFRKTDVITTRPRFGWDYHYEIRVRTSSADGDYAVPVSSGVNPFFSSEGTFRYGTGWRREVQLQSTETMIERSWTPGATATLPASSQRRKIGIVSAKGTQNGVMKIAVGGVVKKTLDLHATSWQPRQVVAALDVPANATVTVTNASPASRAGKDVHVDGVIGFPVEPSGGPMLRALRPRVTAAAAPQESIEARVASPQLLQSSGTGPLLTVTAKVLGCPSGCSLVRRNGTDPDKVLLTRTSPASSTLQTLTASDRLAYDDSAEYVLVKNGSDVAATWSDRSPILQPDSAATYSYGWSRDSSASSSGGRIMRSATPGTGATYQERTGTFEGRNVGLIGAKGPNCGVLGLYVDGKLLQTIDLKATKWQPNQVIASVDLPVTGRITVVNKSLATRAGKDIHVDGFVLLEHPGDYY